MAHHVECPTNVGQLRVKVQRVDPRTNGKSWVVEDEDSVVSLLCGVQILSPPRGRGDLVEKHLTLAERPVHEEQNALSFYSWCRGWGELTVAPSTQTLVRCQLRVQSGEVVKNSVRLEILDGDARDPFPFDRVQASPSCPTPTNYVRWRFVNPAQNTVDVGKRQRCQSTIVV